VVLDVVVDEVCILSTELVVLEHGLVGVDGETVAVVVGIGLLD
jgi:hypothetical protein